MDLKSYIHAIKDCVCIIALSFCYNFYPVIAKDL